MTVKIPSQEHVPAIASLLSESGLPIDDLLAQDLSLFRVLMTGDHLNAVGGLERCGNSALIRSIATSADMRGRGIAGELVDELERLAAEEGFDSLYLLTESAERYFGARGYAIVDRKDVPESIRDSRQFSSLCPDSATVMCKPLR